MFFSIFFQSLKDSTRFYVPFLKRSAWLLVALFIGCEFLHHYFLAFAAATREIQSFNPVAFVGDLLTSLLEYVVFSMLIPLKVMEIEDNRMIGSFTEFGKRFIHPLAVESIRALALVVLWACLFILPGLFKYVRYFFVPFVVVADSAYERGERDALEYSNQLVKGITLPLFILLVILTAFEFLRGSFREQFPMMSRPDLALLAGFGFFLVSIFANLLLFRLYQLRVKALAGGSV